MFYKLVLLCVTLKSVSATVQNQPCKAGIKDITFLKMTNTEERICNDLNPCLLKCCAVDHVLQLIPSAANSKHICVPNNISLDLNANITDDKTSVSFKKYDIYYNKAFVNCASPLPFETYSYNLNENGSVTIASMLGELSYSPFGFCVDRVRNGRENLKLMYLILPDDVDTTCKSYRVYGMLLSSFFMFLVIFVKLILRQYHNMSDRLFVTYLTMLMLAYTNQIISTLYFNFNTEQCHIATPISWFLMHSSVFWLNVMSWDIWWTFRGSRLHRSIHRSGLACKYLTYGLYAWGIPLLLICAAVIWDKMFLGKMKPDFEQCGRPHTIIFFYSPIIILTIANCTLFVLTVLHIWGIGKELKNITDSSNNQSNRNSFGIVIKLSVLNGLSWILDLVQVAADTNTCSWSYNILDSYNFFIGVLIFVVFICNKTTLNQLRKRFKNKNNLQSVQNSSLRSHSASKISCSSRTQA